MGSNIEIKAKASDFQKQLLVAESLSDIPLEILHQEDTFFFVPHGRLKLRVFSNKLGELIFYNRSDEEGVKESKYIISKTSDPSSLKAALVAALGTKGSISKRRYLYMKGQMRIHFDKVEGLGEFIEIEYVLRDNEDQKMARIAVKELISRLGISKEDLISTAYIDMLNSPAI
jgi:predicted adenylyl cyclase CyaB